MSGLALNPCATTLKSIVQTTVSMISFWFGKFISRMMIPKTMLAKPRGPNQPINSLSFRDMPDLTNEIKTGTILTIVRLKIVYSITCHVKWGRLLAMT